ncbi:MAG: PQQ-binding-like beta-propeller repeat protein [Euryarchaeota archaeon]|nr:PQQ-binding-like beta-propeller repeat protein [Euryarchaeota archaeon]
MIRKGMAVGIIALFFVSLVFPVTNSSPPIHTDKNRTMDERFLVDSEHNSKNDPDEPTVFRSSPNGIKDLTKNQVEAIGGPMDSQWPVMSHDVQHTGRSPYSTAAVPFVEKWRFPADGWIWTSPVIDENGVIYFSGYSFFAIDSNGTLKWNNIGYIDVESAPAIGDDGIIYAGTAFASPNHLIAFYPNGTAKWSYPTDNIFSSPVIGEDGVIYFGEYNGNLRALYPNGTLKWSNPNIYSVYSSPAIGDDGTIYCTSWSGGSVYAIYPDNGTIKWQFSTGGHTKANPSIADDGTIYVSSWDDYLYALYPNGTMKWRVNTYLGSSNNPSIGPDGTIYVAHADLYAINPDGTVKWIFPLGEERQCTFSAPAISADGIIYIGACIDYDHGVGGELIVVNPDGTERWRSGSICNEGIASSPAIAEDGTVYIGSLNDYEVYNGGFDSRGYLHAFGPGNVKKIEIEEPKRGELYFFGNEVLSTKTGRTFIVGGPIDVKVKTYTSSELEKNVSILIDFNLQYSSSEPSFVWTLDKRLGRYSYGFHVLKIIATYKGGCEWYEQWWFWYFHL